MERKLFDELTKSIKQAGAIARGERAPSRSHEFTPSRIQAVREQADLSQAQFAQLLNVSVKTAESPDLKLVLLMSSHTMLVSTGAILSTATGALVAYEVCASPLTTLSSCACTV